MRFSQTAAWEEKVRAAIWPIERAHSPEEAIEYYRKALAAGERALGPRALTEDRGMFWGLLETRPYMRAKSSLAELLWEVGKREEALTHFWECLELNPNDNQGVRYVLLEKLLLIQERAGAEKLLKQYKDDRTAEWLYLKALFHFQVEGPSANAKRKLLTAFKSNAFVPAYVTGYKKLPKYLPDSYALGSQDEAICYAADHQEVWRQTPGAILWLASNVARS